LYNSWGKTDCTKENRTVKKVLLVRPLPLRGIRVKKKRNVERSERRIRVIVTWNQVKEVFGLHGPGSEWSEGGVALLASGRKGSWCPNLQRKRSTMGNNPRPWVRVGWKGNRISEKQLLTMPRGGWVESFFETREKEKKNMKEWRGKGRINSRYIARKNHTRGGGEKKDSS